MTRVIVWKEFREQGTIVATLLVMGCGLIAGLSVIATPRQETGLVETLFAVSVLGVALLAIAAGAVIGATLFAGEREAGTFPFLDRLPATRWQLWWRKVLVGLALTAVTALGYLATSLATGQVHAKYIHPALVFGAGAFFGFAWGCVGSVLRRTALGACAAGLSIGVAVTAVAMGFPPLVMEAVREVTADDWRGSTLAQVVAASSVLVPLSAAIVLPLLLSARLFTAPDRKQDVTSLGRFVTASGGRLQRVNRFAWLLARQHRVNVLWLTAVAGVAGGVLLIPDVLFITAWPVATLVAGVLVGVVLFADEQGTEAARFWGERRLRVGGVWGAKLAFGFALTLGLVVVMLLPCVVRGLVESNYGQNSGHLDRGFRTGVIAPGYPIFTYLFLGPVYGLAFGQLAALLFRKPVVALAVGTTVGGTAVAVWFPSLFGGGLHGWQVWAPVAVTLTVSRLLTWPWATETLGQRGPILRLACGLMLVALTFAGGIAWRVLEVPVLDTANDDIEFAKSLPTYDENESGRGVRRAVAEFGAQAAPYVMTRSDFSTPRQPLVMNELFEMLLKSGYPANRPDIDSLLEIFDGCEWEKTLLEASRKPTGVYIDPATHVGDFNQYFDQSPAMFQRMVAVYALRGLKAQRDGDPADFARRVAVLLAVVRTTRTSGPPVAAVYADAVEGATFRSVDHWLRELRGRPELLRQVLTTLLDHERTDTSSPRRTELASQVALRSGVTGPGSWLPRTLGILGGPSREEADVIAFAWAVPWERERLQRAVGYGNSPAVLSAPWRQPNPYLVGAPGLWMYDYLRASLRQTADYEGRVTAFRGCLMQVALRLHEAETGRFPAALGELVPKLLPAVPLDPFAAAPTPLGYRVSVAGESIAVEPAEYVTTPDVGQLAPAFASAAGGPNVIAAVCALTGAATPAGMDGPGGPAVPQLPAADTPRRVTREVAGGQAIVWSVGPDRIDNGGRVSVQPTGSNVTNKVPGDIVFVVPLPAKAKSP